MDWKHITRFNIANMPDNVKNVIFKRYPDLSSEHCSYYDIMHEKNDYELNSKLMSLKTDDNIHSVISVTTASCSSTPASELDNISRDSASSVTLYALSVNPSTPNEIIDYIIRSSCNSKRIYFYVIAAISNPNASIGALRYILDKTDNTDIIISIIYAPSSDKELSTKAFFMALRAYGDPLTSTSPKRDRLADACKTISLPRHEIDILADRALSDWRYMYLLFSLNRDQNMPYKVEQKIYNIGRYGDTRGFCALVRDNKMSDDQIRHLLDINIGTEVYSSLCRDLGNTYKGGSKLIKDKLVSGRD